MCRVILFGGTCTRCGEVQNWEDLAQQLSCLEAKNNGVFGECSVGIYAEQHEFDQECDRCTEEDEGIGDVGEEEQQHLKAMMDGSPLPHDSEHSGRERKKLKM